MAGARMSLDEEFSSIPEPNIKQGVTKKFLDACEKLKTDLEMGRVKRENLMTVLWRIEQLDFKVPEDSLANDSKKELKGVVTELQKFYYKSFQVGSHIRVFSNKMRTQLLKLITRATQAPDKPVLEAAILLMTEMKAEAKQQEEAAMTLRNEAKNLNGNVVAIHTLVSLVIQEMKKTRGNLIEEIKRKEEELENKESKLPWIRTNNMVFKLRNLSLPLIDWISKTFTTELPCVLEKLGINEKYIKDLLECYGNVASGLECISAYLLSDHNFWLEAVGLLDELQREAERKLKLFTSPHVCDETKFVFIDSDQMELLNQILLALETGVQSVMSPIPPYGGTNV